MGEEKSMSGMIGHCCIKGRIYSGAAPALSLVIAIKDMDYVDIYVNSGGIQLASKLSLGKFVPVPRNQLFANEEQNAATVNIA
jgi:hypothetical protein